MLTYGRSVTTLQNQLMPTSFTKSRVAAWLLAAALPITWLLLTRLMLQHYPTPTVLKDLKKKPPIISAARLYMDWVIFLENCIFPHSWPGNLVGSLKNR